MSTAIWWIRRDLRLSDNPALQAAMEHHTVVIPLFVLDETLLHKSSPGRKAFLLAALKNLGEELLARGSHLVLRRGDPKEELFRFRQETDARQVYAQRDYSPFAIRRDAEIAKNLPLVLINGQSIHPPEAIRKADGRPYAKFNAFRNAWKALPQNLSILPEPSRLPDFPAFPSAEPDNAGQSILESACESTALASLDKFMQTDIFQFSTLRDRMDLDQTSHISIALKFGLLSPRQAYRSALGAFNEAATPAEKDSCRIWMGELIWREFFQHILAHHPNVLKEAFNPTFRTIQWDTDEKLFSAWQEGLTGYPLVDAAMRQLNQTGWMHNRCRMVTASFLVKDLHLNWQSGENYFRQKLLDYDPAANNGNWQWAAGCGTDSVPYFRVFNPTLQAEKYDPQGVYIRRWLPELSRVPDSFIHTPWRMPEDIQNQCGCKVGTNYPGQLVEHSRAKLQTLALYRAGRVLSGD
jgi:deoxyribodipyrimidine photo-lyase